MNRACGCWTVEVTDVAGEYEEMWWLRLRAPAATIHVSPAGRSASQTSASGRTPVFSVWRQSAKSSP
jgi:hypothetical protein